MNSICNITDPDCAAIGCAHESELNGTETNGDTSIHISILKQYHMMSLITDEIGNPGFLNTDFRWRR